MNGDLGEGAIVLAEDTRRESASQMAACAPGTTRIWICNGYAMGTFAQVCIACLRHSFNFNFNWCLIKSYSVFNAIWIAPCGH